MTRCFDRDSLRAFRVSAFGKSAGKTYRGLFVDVVVAGERPGISTSDLGKSKA